MRVPLRLVSVLAVSVLTAACSSKPTQPPPSEASQIAAAIEVSAGINPDLVRKGYKARVQGDRILYCRSESATGTIFKRKQCLTEEQIRSLERDAEDAEDVMMRRTRPAPSCRPGECT